MSKTATLFSAVPRMLAGSVLLLMSGLASAQVVSVPTTPQVGSSNPATAEPTVPRPDTKPCTVTLFEGVAFQDYTPFTFSYTPPSDCPGPWSKVVFTGDFTVTAGRQFDRTASFYLGHANIYYGTTAEPRSALSPSWHVERDVTDLSAIFKTIQTGQADLGNFVGVSDGITYNGVIYATAKLVFYPAFWYEPAPLTADIVLPVNGTGGDAGTLNTTSDQITRMVSFPRNSERIYLDVIAQSQSADEFWYLCVPNDQASNLQSCGNTPFRETEVYLDGKAAGVAPVSPWIYTGGIDPYLWEPITGVQTLDFKPYRVDLTPFAAVLDDGKPHVIGVSVFNANSYFLVTANLLIFRDRGSVAITGKLLTNTLSESPTPGVQENISNPSTGLFNGSIKVSSGRFFTASGYVDTSHGRVTTSIDTAVSFSNTQQFDVTPTQYGQSVKQASTVHSVTSTQQGSVKGSVVQDFNFPLTLIYSSFTNPDGSGGQTTQSWQTYQLLRTYNVEGTPILKTRSQEQVHSQDTIEFNSSGSITGTPTGSASAVDIESDTQGHCYNRTVTAVNRAVTRVQDRTSCPAQ